MAFPFIVIIWYFIFFIYLLCFPVKCEQLLGFISCAISQALKESLAKSKDEAAALKEER